MFSSRPFVLLSLSFFFFHFAAAVQHNVSLDDTDALITYRPQTSWESGLRSGLDFGGSHSVSSDPASDAVFNFTGVAVYYLAPRWPYTVGTVITLDGGQNVFVNLTDPDATPTPPGGSESAQYSVAWSATGLSNTTHSVVLTMSPVSANGGVIISDGFIFTTDDGLAPPRSSSSSAHPSSRSSRASTSPSASATSTSKSSNAVAIGIGTALGVSALLAALITAFCILRRRNRAHKRLTTINIIDQDEWEAAHPYLPAPTPFLAHPASAHTPPPNGSASGYGYGRSVSTHVPTMSDASTGPLLGQTSYSDPYHDAVPQSTVPSHEGGGVPEFGASSYGGYNPYLDSDGGNSDPGHDRDFASGSGSGGIVSPRPSRPPAPGRRGEKSMPLRVQTYSPAPPAYSESEQG